MNCYKKISLVLLIFFLLTVSVFSFFPNKAQAQEVWFDQSFGTWYGRVYDPTNPDEVFGERYAAANVQWIMYGLISNVMNFFLPSGLARCIFVSGVGPTLNPVEAGQDAAKFGVCIGEYARNLLSDAEIPNKTPEKNFFATVLEASSPASGIYYIKDRLAKLNPIQEVYAQEGIGFGALNPVLRLWTAVRNMTYIIFVLIIVTLAFMIMFRVRISPQLEITAQSALARIATGLILVTFSYAIAGFLVDLIYIVIGMVALLFGTSGIFQNETWYSLFRLMVNGPEVRLFGGEQDLGILGLLLIYLVGFVVSFFIAVFSTLGLVGSLVTGAAAAIAGFAFAPILGLILTLVGFILIIALVIFVLRILLLILRAYATIVLLVIFAPIQIALGTVIPNLGFRVWLRTLLANLAVFPTIGILFLLAFTFLGGAYSSIQSISLEVFNVNLANDMANLMSALTIPAIQPDLFPTQNWPVPLSGGARILPIIWLGISFVLVSIVPRTADLVRSLIQGQPFNFGAAMADITGSARTGLALAGPEFGYQIGVAGGTMATTPGGGIFGTIRRRAGSAAQGWAERNRFIEYGSPGAGGTPQRPSGRR